MYCSDELFFSEHEFDGTPWEKLENYEKWDPLRFVKNWSTPELVRIHPLGP
jgi:dipeptidyl aminopeptidase/acylaminoacyl peptidase